MTALHLHTATQLHQLLKNRELTPTELTQYYLERIQNIDPKINSFVCHTTEYALAAAAESDKRWQNNAPRSLLDGIPMAHKDNFCTQTIPTTACSKMLAKFVPSYNATVVEKLAQQGAIMLGKLSMDEFAMGSTNETSYFGAVHNPWHVAHVPGGSSGGSAAAVAARLVPYATGTDTGGSVRQPAAHCGITGLKPTYGSVSRWGIIAFASSLDQAGCLANSAEDIAYILNGMAGHDAKDSTSSLHTPETFHHALTDSLKGKRIGLVENYLKDLPPEMATLIEECADAFRQLGAEIVPIQLSQNELAVATYYLIASAEASSNLARYDGVRYGHRAENVSDLAQLYCQSRAEGFGEEVKRRILIGTYALSAGYYDAYYEQARRARRAILNDYQQAFESVDLLLAPTTPTTAPKIGDNATKSKAEVFLSDLYTVGVNLAGLPAISFPVGQLAGLPVGAQLVGAHFSEASLLNAVYQYQQHTDYHKAAPSL